MAELLLELFSEEIPARMQGQACNALKETVTKKLKESNLTFGALEVFTTPRRVTLYIEGLPERLESSSTEKRGPRTDAPQAAIDGFVKSSGLPLEKLEKRQSDKGEFYFAVVQNEGKNTSDILKPMLETILKEFSWPKSMRWNSHELRWVRPLKNICSVFEGKTLPMQLGHIASNNQSYGHRFMAPDAFTVTSFSQYQAELEKRFVILDGRKRSTKIKQDAEKLAAKHGLTLRADEGLLEEVVGLVEWPVVLQAKIDSDFMHLPPELLVSSIRTHQRYLCFEGKDGTLSAHFAIAANIEASDGGKAIIAGNERVLRARLSDAKFFYEQDQKHKLDAYLPKLKDITFHAKIGTVAEKVERITALSLLIAEKIKADKKQVERAATLCKADLVTGMVGEFPELQGIMGGYYALKQGEAKEVADAIRNHYKPQGPNDSIPTEPVSICVALADKLDTLTSMFAAGEKPTGSKDPFALRRSALGIIRIILENNLRLPLSSLLQNNDELLAFFHDRLKVQMKDQGLRHDVINAVVAGGDDDLFRVVARAKALQSFLESENGKNLVGAFRRAANILSIEEKKYKTTYAAKSLDTSLLKEQEELSLAQLLEEKAPGMEAVMRKEEYVQTMKLLAELRAPLDLFFDKIMVNTEDKTLRIERLNLLARIRDTINVYADFSKIEG